MRTALVLAFAATLLCAQAPKPLAPAPKAPAPKAPVAATPSATGFVGNKSSKIVHKADCKSVAKIADKNKVALASKEEATKGGFKPCKNCNP